MATPVLPVGLWPVMLTPFRDDGSIDFAGLQRLTDFYIDAGSAGLFANCLSSEMFQLNPEERLSIVRCVVQQAGGRVPVVACGNFERDAASAGHFIARMGECGVAAVVLITGMLTGAGEDDSRLMAAAEAIMESTGDIPLGLYECPQPYKRLLTAEMIGRLAASGRFLYHKDTSCRSDHIREKLRATGGTALRFYNADTPTALQSLLDGAHGLSPIGANFYPELYAALIGRVRSGGMNRDVGELHARLAVMDRLCHHLYPLTAKLFLKLRGLDIGPTLRLPTDRPAEGDRIRLEALLKVFRTMAGDLGITPVLP